MHALVNLVGRTLLYSLLNFPKNGWTVEVIKLFIMWHTETKQKSQS